MTRLAIDVLVLAFLLTGGAVGGALGVDSAITEVDRSPASMEIDPPVERWNRTYDSPGQDIFSSITPTTDGGYLLTGYTDRDGTLDGWVVRIDATGEQQWGLTVGGNGTDRLYDAVQTSDGAFLLAGRTTEGGQARGWLLTVEGGHVVRNRTVGSRPGGLRAIDRSGPDVFIAGWTWDGGRAGWLANVDEDGALLWERTYRDEHDVRVKALVADGEDLFVAGRAETDSGADAWVATSSTSGDGGWNRTIDEAAWDDVWAATGTDSGYALAGETGGVERAERDAWVVNLGSDGTVERSLTFGAAGHDWFDSATATADGVLFTGGTASGGIGSADGLLVSIGPDGTERWRSVIGTTRWDKPWPAIETREGGYLLAGQTAGYGADQTAGWVVSLSKPAGGSNATSETSESDAVTTNSDSAGGQQTRTSETSSSGGTATGSTNGGSSLVPGLVALVLVLFVGGAVALHR